MGAATPNQSLSTVGESLLKDSQNAPYRATWPALFISLDSYPMHCFSEAGRASICKRHGISDAELELCLCAYVHPDAPTETERRAAELARLLGAIEAAVKPAPKRKTAPKGKQKGGAKC
jgi:hypothetical protein